MGRVAQPHLYKVSFVEGALQIPDVGGGTVARPAAARPALHHLQQSLPSSPPHLAVLARQAGGRLLLHPVLGPPGSSQQHQPGLYRPPPGKTFPTLAVNCSPASGLSCWL